MARDISTEIEIAAPASRVWEILTDFEAFPSWNPFVREISGELREGAQLEVLLRAPNMSPITVKPRLVALQPERELRWLGHLWVRGLFDGEHRFQIEPTSETSVRFLHAERFSGLLVSPMLNRIGENTRLGFKTMNEALKARAEGPEE